MVEKKKEKDKDKNRDNIMQISKTEETFDQLVNQLSYRKPKFESRKRILNRIN